MCGSSPPSSSPPSSSSMLPPARRENPTELGWTATVFAIALAVAGVHLLGTRNLLLIVLFVAAAVVIRYATPYITPRAIAFAIRPRVRIDRIGARGIHRLHFALSSVELHVEHIALRINRTASAPDLSATAAGPTTDAKNKEDADPEPLLQHTWLTVIIKNARIHLHPQAGLAAGHKRPPAPACSFWKRATSHVPRSVATAAAHCVALARAVLAAALRASMHAIPFAAQVIDIQLEGGEIILGPRPVAVAPEEGDRCDLPPVVTRIGQARIAATYTLEGTGLTSSKVAATTWLSRLPAGSLSIQLFLTTIVAYMTTSSPDLPRSGDEGIHNALWTIPGEEPGAQSMAWPPPSPGGEVHSDIPSTIPYEQRVLYIPGTTSALLRLRVGDLDRSKATRGRLPGPPPSRSGPVQVDVRLAPAVAGLDALSLLGRKAAPAPTPAALSSQPPSSGSYDLIDALEKASFSLPFVRLVSSLRCPGLTQALASDVSTVKFTVRRAYPEEPVCAQWLEACSVSCPPFEPEGARPRGTTTTSTASSSSVASPQVSAGASHSRSLAHLPYRPSRVPPFPPPSILLHGSLSMQVAQVYLAPENLCIASIGPVKATSAISIPAHMLLPPTQEAIKFWPSRTSPLPSPMPADSPSPPLIRHSLIAPPDSPEPHDYPQCTIYLDVVIDKAAICLPEPLLAILRVRERSTRTGPDSSASYDSSMSLPQLHVGLRVRELSIEVNLPAPPLFPSTSVPVDPKAQHHRRPQLSAIGRHLARLVLPSLNVALHGHFAQPPMQAAELGTLSQYVFDTHAYLGPLKLLGGAPGGVDLLPLLQLGLLEMRCSGALEASYHPQKGAGHMPLDSIDVPRKLATHGLPSITLDRGDMSSHILVDGLSFSLDRPASWDAIAGIVLAFSPPTRAATSQHPQRLTVPRPTKPAWGLRKYVHTLALRNVNIKLATVDPARPSSPAGIHVSLSRATLERAACPPRPPKATRFAWDPRQSYGLEQTAFDRAQTVTGVYGGHTSATLMTVTGLTLMALQPAAAAPKSFPADPITPVNDHKDIILSLPSARVMLDLRPVLAEKQRNIYVSRRGKGTSGLSLEEQSMVRVNFDLLEPLCLAIQLNHTYCLLMAGAGLRRIGELRKAAAAPPPQTSASPESEEMTPTSSHKSSEPTPPAECPRPLKPTWEVNVAVREINVPIALPLGMECFVGARGIKASWRPQAPLQVHWEEIVGAPKRIHPPPIGGSSLHFESSFSEMVRARNGTAVIRFPLYQPGSQSTIALSGQSLLVSIPYNYRLYELIDATTVSIKATKQLIHEVLLGRSGNWLSPSEQSPIRMPRVQLSFSQVVLEGEDDPFESALGRILCAGKQEQLRRLERAAAFDDKMEQVFKHGTGVPSRRSSTSTAASTLPQPNPEMDMAEIVRKAAFNLAVYEASSWKSRIRATQATQQQREDAFRGRLLQRNGPRSHNRTPHGAAGQGEQDQAKSQESPESWLVDVVSRPAAPPLFRLVVSNPVITMSEPSFSCENTRAFITEQGGPIPPHLRFSICAPFHFHWEFDEALMQIRDYPLPLVHVSSDLVVPDPAATSRTVPRTWVMDGDLCIAEQMGGPESTRYVPALIFGANSGEDSCDAPYTIHVPKVSLPTKFFGSPVITIRSGRPLHVSWGASYQAAVADMVRTFDSFSRPPTDPSRKIGFWDKLPLLFHGELSFIFPPTEGERPGESQSGVHLYLKGSRDPYALDGPGAGWVMCWHKGVTVTFGRDNPEKEVLQFKSTKFILGIPDLSSYGPKGATVQEAGRPDHGLGLELGPPAAVSLASHTRLHSLAGLPILNAYGVDMSWHEMDLRLQKTVWHLGGAVTWGLGFILERTCSKWDCHNTPRCQGEPFNRKCRFWDHISHWQVITKVPDYFKGKPADQRRDTYLGWRHDHIHFAIGVRSHEIEGATSDAKANSLHITPLTSAHFWAWINLYRSSLGLPIRQGKLFDTPQRPPKFGPHLATIKYRLDLAPLYFSHVYLQEDVERYRRNAALFVGIKCRVDKFDVDVHQRQQATEIERKGLGEVKKVLHKPINELEVNFAGLEARAVCAELADPVAGSTQTAHPPDLDQQGEDRAEENATDRFLRSGSDASGINDGWWDLDDYVELGTYVGRRTSLSATARGRTETVLQCPAFNYYKKLRTRKEVTAQLAETGMSETDEDGGDPTRPAQQTHRSVMFATESKFGHEATHTCLIGHTPTVNRYQRKIVRQRLQDLRQKQEPTLEERRNMKLLSRYYAILTEADSSPQPDTAFSPHRPRPLPLPINVAGMGESLDEQEWANEVKEMQEQWALFSNRYLFHCPIVLISDVTRGILTKYYHSNRDRRGFAHYLKAQALRTIRELDLGSRSLDLPSEGRPSAEAFVGSPTGSGRHGHREHSSDEGGLGQLRNMLRDTMQSFNPLGDKGASGSDASTAAAEKFDATVGIHPDFDVRMSTLCVLLRPQIVLCNEKEDSSVVLSATRARLHNYTVRDYDFVDDDINQQVMHRNMIAFDQMQCWHPPAHLKRGLQFEQLLSGEKGVSGLEPIIPRTNCNLQYDKFNKLRLQDASKPCADLDALPPDQDHLRYNMDLVRIHCPHFSIRASHDQFAALYSITTGLVLYRDPGFKAQTKQLETVLFAYNFHDPEELADIVETLQHSIHEAQREQAVADAVYSSTPTQEHHEAAVASYQRSVELHRELGLFNAAISVAQDRRSGSDKEKRSALLLEAEASEVGWSMMIPGSTQSVADVRIRGVHFQWLNKTDNSALNRLVVDDLHARNNRPDALFTDMIARYTKNQQGHPMVEQGRFLDVTWAVLAPVGGISVIQQFEINLHPLRVQLEIAVGREMMAYIFGKRDSPSQSLPPQAGAFNQASGKRRVATTVPVTSPQPAADQHRGGTGASISLGTTDTARRKLGSSASMTSLHAPLRTRSQSLLRVNLPRAKPSTDTLTLTVPDGEGSGASSAGLADGGRSSPANQGDNESVATSCRSSRMSSARAMPGRPASPTPDRRHSPSTSHSVAPISNASPGAGRSGMVTRALSISERTDTVSQFGISVRDEDHAIALRNALEMRERAAMNRTFVLVRIPQTFFCLSFKSDKGKSITDLYDVVVKSPEFEYHNQTWSYEDLVNHFKRKLFWAAWNQRTTLLRGFLTQRPRKISAKLALRDKIRAQAGWAQKMIQDLDQSAKDDRMALLDEEDGPNDSQWLDQALLSPQNSPPHVINHSPALPIIGVQAPTSSGTSRQPTSMVSPPVGESNVDMLLPDQTDIYNSPASGHLSLKEPEETPLAPTEFGPISNDRERPMSRGFVSRASTILPPVVAPLLGPSHATSFGMTLSRSASNRSTPLQPSNSSQSQTSGPVPPAPSPASWAQLAHTHSTPIPALHSFGSGATVAFPSKGQSTPSSALGVEGESPKSGRKGKRSETHRIRFTSLLGKKKSQAPGS